MKKLSLILFIFISCAGKQPPPTTPQKSEAPPELQQIWNDPGALFQKASQLSNEANYSLALKALDRVLAGFPKSEVYPKAQKLSEEIHLRLGLSGTKIGVLLPLSGPFSRFGEAVLNGITCAIGLFDPCPLDPSKIQVIVRDTEGSPEKVDLSIQELINQENVSAVIGPLLSQEMETAVKTAGAKDVPILVLAPQKMGASPNPFVFQHALLPEQEVSEIVKKASPLLSQFIILYPQNRYGEEYHLLFKEALEKQGGGKILLEQSYSPELPDFTGVLEQLFQKGPVKKLLQKEKSEIGLFIPDSFRQIVKIAEGLDNLSLKGVKLIGTSRWYHPKLLGLSFASLEGAILDTPFYPEAKREEVSSFVEAFTKTYGDGPAWLEAFGFDAMRLIQEASKKKESSTPNDIRDGLALLSNFQAVVGPLSWSPENNSTWPLDFLTIHEGKFVSLEP